MKIPSILVVMPLYNTALYVKEAVESILVQTYPNFILLIIDDGSTDNSVEVVQAFDDPRIKVLHQKNSGPGAAMNKGIGYATELNIPYIARMDSDDVSLPERLEIQLNILEKDKNIAVCSSNCYYINEENEIVGSSTVPSKNKLIQWEIKNGLRGLIQGASIFRTDALNNVGGYRSQFRLAEETDLFLRLAENYKFLNSEEYLYKIRIRNRSLSLSNFRKNLLFSNYALYCAKRRRAGNGEPEFIEYQTTMSVFSKISFNRELLALKYWQNFIAKKNFLMLFVSSILDPKRVLARFLRKINF